MSPEPVTGPPREDGDTGPFQPTPDVPASATVQWQPLTDPDEAPHSQSTERPPALAIPGYEILEEVGRGGMGVVFKARHLQLNRIVALKMILSGELASAQETNRLRSEAETIAQVQHPNIIQIFEIGEHEGRLFLSLEYCGGGSLEHLLRGTPLPAIEASRLLLTLAGAIEHAHFCGVIHRDLKPANILLQDRGPQVARSAGPALAPVVRSFGPGSNLVPKITDFGLAQPISEAGQAASSAIIGTPWYMSPEQASGKKAGPRSDVYALGGTLYECLTGRPPFKGPSPMDTIFQVLSDEPVPPRHLQRNIPRDLETICLKCLQKDPARRYGSAGELREDLQRFLDGKAIQARPTGWLEHTWRWCRRNPVVAGLLSLVAVLVLSGMVVGSIALVVIEKARQEAANNAEREAVARTHAEVVAAESRERLIRLHIATGTRFLDANDRASALCWYEQAWRSDPHGADSETDHRLRLASVLSAGPQLVGICFHHQPVQDAAVSPEGNQLLSYTVAGRDVYLWDPMASHLAAAPLRHEGEVRHACYSPDGRLVGTAAADGTACIWDAHSGKRLWKLDHSTGVAWLAFRPGTSQLVTVDDRGTLHGWDTTTGQPAGVWPRSDGGVWYVAFSEDGRLLVTADRNNWARVWDAATGEAKTPPLPHLALSPEEAYFRYKRWPMFNAAGTLLLTATKETLHLWDTATGAARWPSERSLDKNQAAPMHLAFNRRGDRLVVCQGYIASVLGVADGQEVFQLTHPRMNQYTTFSHDDRHLVSVSSGGTVHLWDAATGKAVDLPLSCADFVRRVEFFPDNRRFFAASLDGTVRVWSLPKTTDALAPYAADCGHADKCQLTTSQGFQTFSPDGSLCAHYGPAGIEVQRRKGAQQALWQSPDPVRWARFTADGHRLLVANLTEVRSCDANTGRQLGQLIPLDASLDSRDFVLRTARIDATANGRRLATLEDPRTISVWEVETGRRLLGPLRDFNRAPYVFGPPEAQGRIAQPHLTPDGRTLVLGVPSSGTLAAWDVTSGQDLFQTKRFSGNLHDLAISEDGASMLAVSSNTTARLFTTRDGVPLGPPLVHTGTVIHGDLAGDRTRVVTLEGTTVRLWDARNGDLLARLPAVPKDVEALWFSRDGKRVILGGTEEAFTWQLPSLEMPAAPVRLLVQLLTSRDIDEANGLTQLDQHAILNDPAPYRQAWLTWRGRADDAEAQP
jgi:serine/threonine protein kinase/WD40 repeat protein